MIERDKSRYFAVVPAAGVGKRMNADVPKQYLMLHNKTVFEHTLEKLLSDHSIQQIIVPVNPDDDFWNNLSIATDERIKIVEGGLDRSHSVLNGLHSLSGICRDHDWVLVHDIARPCVGLFDINNLKKQLSNSDTGGLLGVPVSDTVKLVSEKNAVTSTVDRSNLWHAQTPQMFRYRLLLEALTAAIAKGKEVTDEASAIEIFGKAPVVVEGSRENIKITRPEDLSLASFYLSSN